MCIYRTREVLRQSARSKHRDDCAAKHKVFQLHMRSLGKEWNWLLFSALFFASSLHWFVSFGFQSNLFSPFLLPKPRPSIMNLTSLPLTCLSPTPTPTPFPTTVKQFNTLSSKISSVHSIWPHHLSALYSVFLTTDDELSICSPPVFHSSSNFSCSSHIPINNRIHHLTFNLLAPELFF